jgi:hypothetical protein
MVAQSTQKRRFPRIAETHTVMVRRADSGLIEGFANTKDISTGGCEFSSYSKIEIGVSLDLMLSLDNRIIKVCARVLRQTPRKLGGHCIGVEFTIIEDQAREMLASLIALENISSRNPVEQCPTSGSAVA